ncbi:aspartate/glutamate racemase family protein [Algicola sagamiensis]|uniref:aspartate/glutamate racemase family protein n=1 Tax=Algicola sagamiensis TaxID=163869 RepID=UPI0003777AE6|nr:aspartate/glutamate racemase family protein [Algicola sagamiensis]
MKTIGLLGGMSWTSTESYYRLINQEVQARLGGLHSAKLCLYSVDFHEIEALQRSSEWDKAGEKLSCAASHLEKAGADFLLICTNTMHKVALHVQSSIDIPLLHIADATAKQLTKNGIQKVGLLGTRFTMEQDFYKGRLKGQFGIDVVVPDQTDRQYIHDVIFQELCRDKISSVSRERYIEVTHKLQKKGAEGVILGCTEIAMLLEQQHLDLPLFDTTAIHARAAVDLALSEHLI